MDRLRRCRDTLLVLPLVLAVMLAPATRALALLDPLRADGRPERVLGLSHQQGIALALCTGALVCQHLAARRQRTSAA